MASWDFDFLYRYDSEVREIIDYFKQEGFPQISPKSYDSVFLNCPLWEYYESNGEYPKLFDLSSSGCFYLRKEVIDAIICDDLHNAFYSKCMNERYKANEKLYPTYIQFREDQKMYDKLVLKKTPSNLRLREREDEDHDDEPPKKRHQPEIIDNDDVDDKVLESEEEYEAQVQHY
jgi:hypothetical protein